MSVAVDLGVAFEVGRCSANEDGDDELVLDSATYLSITTSHAILPLDFNRLLQTSASLLPMLLPIKSAHD